MQRLTIDLVIFMLCWTLPQPVSAEDFLAILTGDYDNMEQFQNGFENHSFIQLRVIPADIDCLQPAFTWYVEWAADGKVLHMQIGVITERPGVGTDINLYNFTTDPSLYKPGEFKVSTLAGLNSTDLSTNNCTAKFKQLGKALFVGYWPDCRSYIRGNHPNYADAITCTKVSVTVPPTVKEKFVPSPYILRRTGTRYLFSRLPDTYDSICGGQE